MSKIKEKFVWVNGFEGKYMIGDYGTLMSFIVQTGRYGTGYGTRSEGKVLTPLISKDGYWRYALYDGVNKRPKQYTAHRLVYTNFIGDAPEFDNKGNYLDISHVDHNKDHNWVTNLVLETHKDNLNRNYSHLTKPIACYALDGQLIKKYPSVKSTSDDGYEKTGIRKAMRDNRPYKKMVWKFLKKEN